MLSKMQNPEKKSSFIESNINQILKQELVKEKFVKKALYLGAGVFGLFALGFLFKAINYTANNFKNLTETLKR